MPTLIFRKANNWVDRGAPAQPKLELILAHGFDRHAESDQEWRAEHAAAVHGMVAAAATEIHVAGYLRSVARDLGLPAGEPAELSLLAVALWHASKAAQVRDLAERALEGVPQTGTTKEPLAHWLAARLLTPEELAAYERGPRDE